MVLKNKNVCTHCERQKLATDPPFNLCLNFLQISFAFFENIHILYIFLTHLFTFYVGVVVFAW